MVKKYRSIIKSFAVIIVLLSMFICASCKKSGLDIIVSDYETQKVLSVINTVDEEKRSIDIIDALSSSEYTSDNVLEEEVYSILLEDPKDSTYDIWYKVVIENDVVYVSYDIDKMDVEYAKKFVAVAGDEGYKKCMDITAEEFEKLLFN